MQYQVPQFIDVEDRIIGPLTLKQFLYLAFDGAVLFVLWFIIPSFLIWAIIAVPLSALAAAFAFLKINDRPFAYFFLAVIGYFMKPRLYIFSTAPSAPRRPLSEKPAETIAPKTAEEKVTRSRLKELALMLDTGAKRQ